MPFNVKKRSGDRSHIIFQVPTSQVCCTCTYLIKNPNVKKVLPLLVSIKMWVSALLKEDTCTFRVQLRLGLMKVLSTHSAKTWCDLEQVKKTAADRRIGILLPKLFWPTVKKNLFQWTRRTFEIRFWRPRICKKFSNH